jgi:hypothetical protein
MELIVDADHRGTSESAWQTSAALASAPVSRRAIAALCAPSGSASRTTEVSDGIV